MDEVNEIFRGLVGVVTSAPVRILQGTWARTPSPHNAEFVDCHYLGAFEGDVPLVGLAMLVEANGLRWVKSHIGPSPRTDWECSLHGWAASRRNASMLVRLPGVFLSSIAEDIDEPPDSCVIHEGHTTTGVPHVLFRLPTLTCAVVFLCRTDVQSGRNRIWHLRPELAAQLPPTLALCVTRRRTGHFLLNDREATA